ADRPRRRDGCAAPRPGARRVRADHQLLRPGDLHGHVRRAGEPVMGDVGLLLVGVVLLVNGLVALGTVPARSAAPLNVAVGVAQVVLPTLVLVLDAGDRAVLQATWPSYLFGITYLWYGLQIIHRIEPEGFRSEERRVGKACRSR